MIYFEGEQIQMTHQHQEVEVQVFLSFLYRNMRWGQRPGDGEVDPQQRKQGGSGGAIREATKH